MPFTANDAAHVFFGLPVLCYGYLIVLDTYGALGKGRKLPKWGEYSFLIGFGFVIFVGEIFAYNGCSINGAMCHDINEMHILFGIFMMAAGGIGLMHCFVKIFSHGAQWMTPITLSVVGVFMTQHHQDADYGTFIHTAFGYSALFTSLLRAAAIYDPYKWSIFLSWSSAVTAMSFVVGSDSMEDFLSPLLMPHTVILSVCCIAVVLLIPLMLFVHHMNKGQLPPHHTKLEEDSPRPPRYVFSINNNNEI